MPPRPARTAMTATPSGSRPVAWDPTKDLLSQHPEEIRPALYLKTHPRDNLLIEYTINRTRWAGYNIVETFDRYGWSGVCDFDNSKVYGDIVQEWMSTLKRVVVPGNNEQMKLVGSYKGHVVEMNVHNLRTLFRVDTGYLRHLQMDQVTDYQCVDSRETAIGVPGYQVHDLLFKPGAQNFDAFAELEPRARVLQRVIIDNVNPRNSDQKKIREQDKFVLYSLLTGSYFISYAYNAMCNIWHAYDHKSRSSTPHAALISQYLVHYLPPRLPKGPSRGYALAIQPNTKSLRGIEFGKDNGRCVIIDKLTGRTYTAPEGLGADYEEEGVMPPDDAIPQQQGYGAETPGWFTAYTEPRIQWEQEVTQQLQSHTQSFQGVEDRFSTLDGWRGSVDSSLAEITTLLRRMDTRGSEHYAMDRQQFHDQEYYRYVDYQRAQQYQPDPMDVEYPQPAAPLHYRAGPSYEPPPPTEFQQYQPPPPSEYTGVMDSIYHGIFGHPPSYPGSHNQPPPQ